MPAWRRDGAASGFPLVPVSLRPRIAHGNDPWAYQRNGGRTEISWQAASTHARAPSRTYFVFSDRVRPLHATSEVLPTCSVCVGTPVQSQAELITERACHACGVTHVAAPQQQRRARPRRAVCAQHGWLEKTCSRP